MTASELNTWPGFIAALERALPAVSALRLEGLDDSAQPPQGSGLDSGPVIRLGAGD